jgi:hypothetical protein
MTHSGLSERMIRVRRKFPRLGAMRGAQWGLSFGGVSTMEEAQPMVFDRRWSLVFACVTWFAAFMCMMAYGLSVH